MGTIPRCVYVYSPDGFPRAAGRTLGRRCKLRRKAYCLSWVMPWASNSGENRHINRSGCSFSQEGADQPLIRGLFLLCFHTSCFLLELEGFQIHVLQAFGFKLLSSFMDIIEMKSWVCAQGDLARGSICMCASGIYMYVL